MVKVSTALDERHVIAPHARDETADDIDARDHQTRDGVAAHELACSVHGAEEFDLLLQGGAAPARFAIIDDAGGQVGVDGHLFAWQRVQCETRGDLGYAARPARDDGEVHHQEDKEHDRADDQTSADRKLAEGLNDVTGGARSGRAA